MLISVPIILRNVLHLDYPIDRVIQSVVDYVDEVILCADPTSNDFTLDFAKDQEKRFDNVKVIESAWDMSNVDDQGSEFARQTNIAFGQCAGDFIFSLQADETIHEDDFKVLKEHTRDDDVDAYSMMRWYFYGDINTVRTDWTIPIIRFFRRGTRWSTGDAHNTDGSARIKDSPVKIYHYSRIGDPEIISKRIRTLDGLFHDKKELVKEKDLEPYDFTTYNFDCMHKENVDVGRREVKEPVLIPFIGTHPKVFKDYK